MICKKPMQPEASITCSTCGVQSHATCAGMTDAPTRKPLTRKYGSKCKSCKGKSVENTSTKDKEKEAKIKSTETKSNMEEMRLLFEEYTKKITKQIEGIEKNIKTTSN